ncbi:prophage tail fiber N-terminal domain-containing protein [Serratia liquefaciens]|uniref:prophage tail fiber N-terminal domain-containing protein n=2 Tax=Serratia liquefaciens TaxID=614 RepID=UPI00217C703D|nr:prophage tail fiber N-terminal domain-containing protein [Serratia liquefaciens]CAI1540998.1 Prophage tail fibre N-terminal [Serratia liquefaciens]
MVLISGVLKGPYGDPRPGVTITMRSLKTSSTVLNLAKSQSVTNDSGLYSLNVEPGAYEVIISVYGAQPERVGTIEVYADSLPGSLNDFLRRPGESDITPEIVQTVDAMRADAAKSAAAAKVSEQNSADNVKPVVAAGFGAGPLHTADAFSKDNKSSIQRFTNATLNRPANSTGGLLRMPIDGGPTCSYFAVSVARQTWVGTSNSVNPSVVTWSRLFSTSDLPAVADISNIKDWGLSKGVTAASKGNFNAQMQSRRGYVATDPIGNPFKDTGTYFLDTRSWAVTQTGADDSYRTVQTCYGYGISAANVGKIAIRSWNGATFTPWIWLWSEANTTVDSNGFIKKASPIARLSGAPEKMADDYLDGFTLAGNVAVNGEAEGVSGERVSVGVYKVTGSLGFAEEGWNIEVPQDVNGNRLCFVETSTGKDGTIYVKVSKRRFDIDTAAIVAGDPMDIPDGRWIDLRLEMPMREVVEDPLPVEPVQPPEKFDQSVAPVGEE